MFERFLFRKKILKIVLNEYEKELPYYISLTTKAIETLSPDTTNKDILKMNYDITQKYYEKVINNVSAKLSENNPKFRLRFFSALTSNLCGYDVDLEHLSAGTVYAIAYWTITNKSADIKDCVFINHYVCEIKNKSLKKLDDNAE